MIGGIYVDINQDGIEEFQYSNYNNIVFYGINSHLTLNTKTINSSLFIILLILNLKAEVHCN